MSPFLWATSSFQKNHNEPPKVAQLAKNAQSGHPGRAEGQVNRKNVQTKVARQTNNKKTS